MQSEPKKILVIQTAFIGDAILATATLESLHHQFPNSEISILVRKGNESLFQTHAFLKQIIIWNKKEGKYRSLLKILSVVRKAKFDVIVNLHRFASSGFITGFSRAKFTVGFKKNPLSYLFNKRIEHSLAKGQHEVERNLQLLQTFCKAELKKPKLYFSQEQEKKVIDLLAQFNCSNNNFYCFAPSSVWFTKQLPVEKWIELGKSAASKFPVFILGAESDAPLANQIIYNITPLPVHNLCGKLSLTESALLMKYAKMNYVNDSAPMHLASAVNAPVTAFFCSTVPSFGFGPLSSQSFTVEVNEKLDCRPCGLHGYRSCPKGHFKCGHNITLPLV